MATSLVKQQSRQQVYPLVGSCSKFWSAAHLLCSSSTPTANNIVNNEVPRRNLNKNSFVSNIAYDMKLHISAQSSLTKCRFHNTKERTVKSLTRFLEIGFSLHFRGWYLLMNDWQILSKGHQSSLGILWDRSINNIPNKWVY